MFKEIFRFEIRQSFARPSTYIYFGILFLLSLLIGLASAGAFSTSRSDSFMVLNSAYTVSGVLLTTGGNIFSILFCIILISTVGTVIQRDYQYRTFSLFFTKPVSKAAYFFGRLGGGLLVGLFIFSAMLLGYLAGLFPAIGKGNLTVFRPLHVLQPFLIFTAMNALVLGILFFSLTTYLRNTMAAYVFAVIFMVLEIAAGMIANSPDHKMAAAIIEPLGVNAFSYITEYWTPDEKNNNLIPVTGVLLYNRLLWLGIAFLTGGVVYLGFSFSQFLQPLRLFKRGAGADADLVPEKIYDHIPDVRPRFDYAAKCRMGAYLTAAEFRRVVKTPFFLVILLLCFALFILAARLEAMFADTPTYQVTYEVVSMVTAVFPFFGMLFLIFSSGTMVWRDKENKADELIGATPAGTGVIFFSRFLALAGILLLLYITGAIAGIVLELYNNDHPVYVSQYLVAVSKSFMQGIVILGVCMAIQSFSANKYLGFFFSLLPLLFLPIAFSFLEWNSDLYDFNGNGVTRPYSDMNGYGGGFYNWVHYRIYWTGFAGALCLLGILFYPRGKEKGMKARWKLTRSLRTPQYIFWIFGLLVLTGAAGWTIYRETHLRVFNPSPKETERLMADMEKKYKKYERVPQPRIVAVSLLTNIYPKTQGFTIAGTYTLLNKHNRPVDTIYFDYPGGKKSRTRFSRFEIAVPSETVSDDRDFGVRIIKLKRPLMPGDSVEFYFNMNYSPHSNFDKVNAVVLRNGTFFNNQQLPSIGYNKQGELGENKARKEQGLLPKARMAKIDDSVALQNNYISRDADWIRFEATVATDEGQIAIAPGYLQKEWSTAGRKYYHYKMDSPILDFYSFLSADYQVKRDRWKDVAIEIYYQKGHEYNLDRMVHSVKKSLDYYTAHFGPYQHRQVCIVEFPRYQHFAQSFPNTIPFSEAIGFIMKVKKAPGAIDLPFYVTAHEVAHQWWAHQVIGGDVQGRELMSETMSQYSALMVMEKEYGKDGMRRFLKREMDHYLKGRTFEGKGELPLMLCEFQQYIHYNKGSVVMYALKDFIGEDRLNSAIRAFLDKNRYSGPPYTTAVEFVGYLRQATPDSLQYLLTDMFERITIYENYIKTFTFQKVTEGKYKVTLTAGSAKFYADSAGKQKAAAVNDYMDIGVFGARKENGNENPLVLQRVKMDQPEKTFEFIVNEKPVKAGIDPYLKLIDRIPKNNVLKAGQVAPKVDLDPNTPVINMGFDFEED